MLSYTKYMSTRLNEHQDDKKAKWLENYVKHDIKSLGVGIPIIREILKTAEHKFELSKKSFTHQEQVLDELMSNEYTEFKLAAILFIQLYGQSHPPEQLLALISNWFDKHWINDWNVCDWLCVRLLSPMVDNHPSITINTFQLWNKDSYLWKARASLVPFAQCKTLQEHKNIIHELSRTLIQREERFCKTSVGWVMREISKFDQNYVESFLDDYDEWCTKEVIRNAKKYT
ncbi:MAG: DNA alkylation repair protein [Candidatus Marinimicrobia bacterium]|jgi:3-methyladenine DNA glycosylase AlkD|nr:DNA alkylation repair protein [Candidatus Neomarinimicrobiota bacterium]MBT4130808.1 DNA alkylation repair protein [Candidatus Neomarinimicrobiota bacterium]MBT4419184.1 DNA alkylation repair protein [Candidatus Neomarinimicrobiota bacterium]MBT6003326.1 DNA alkylation repair protein [Candidatus Neomarinimicrobiota bacterium]MBT6759200.1 DNA alkylation repair protein [Candidatus Neomarinimicrobiota bacterium]